MSSVHFVTAGEMRQIEKAAFDSGMSYLDMMEEAGNAAADIILEKMPQDAEKAFVLCGSGNNGGDGLVVARHLAEAGMEVIVCFLDGTAKTPTARLELQRLPETVQFFDLASNSSDILSFLCSAILVDAVFGIGYRFRPNDKSVNICSFLRGLAIWSAAIDLVSGVEADTGCCDPAERKPVDLAIALGCWKPCHLTNWRRIYEREEVLAETSLSQFMTPGKPGRQVLAQEDFSCPSRLPWGHKGTNGRLVLLCGSGKYPGAAALATGAALRSGVGYACITSTKEVCSRVGLSWPEAVQNILPADEDGGISPEGFPQLEQILESASAVVAGCGLGNTESTFFLVKTLLENCTVPLVLDADALNVLEGHWELLKTAECPLILTPHPGELNRLLTGFRQETESIDEAVQRLVHETGVFLVRKDAITQLYQNGEPILASFRGNAGLARGGSGDVLAGLIGSMLAQQFLPVQAVRNALWLHGRAAEITAKHLSVHSMLPSDLISALSSVFLEA